MPCYGGTLRLVLAAFFVEKMVEVIWVKLSIDFFDVHDRRVLKQKSIDILQNRKDASLGKQSIA
jgi:hypothetical protein